MLKLYSYFRSSAAYRVRIALNYKQVDYETVGVNLVTGEQKSENYLSISAQGLVPALELESGAVISQSTAILDWLEDNYPAPKLYPTDSLAKAQLRTLTNDIACDIHPLNNLRVLKYLKNELEVTEEQKSAWYHHWINEGFIAIECALRPAPYAMGSEPSMLDVFLVPQVFNALRFETDMTPYPKIMAAYAACNELGSFIAAAPQNQPDAT